MNQTLIITNNYCFLEKIKKNYQHFIFATKGHGTAQREFYQKRFNELKKVVPNIEIINTDNIESSDYLSWDSYEETKISKGQLLPVQNRLFEKLDFKMPEGFTSFRKKAEGFLPDLYEEAIQPIDQEVISRIDFYFGNKKLPSSYFDTRNGLLGVEYSTQLSPYLSCGALDVRYIYNCVKNYEQEYGDNKSTYWIIFELLWREFFYWHYQKHKELYFSENGLKGESDFSIVKNYSFDELRNLQSPSFFKACLNELEKTGFLSNRARQIFASIWINDLGLPWRSGALLFEHHLIDYDVYSNYGNWMYLAGVGVDPRGKRYFNVEKQLDMYDPRREYEKYWLGGV